MEGGCVELGGRAEGRGVSSVVEEGAEVESEGGWEYGGIELHYALSFFSNWCVVLYS